jgi:hypothetical protein
MSSSTMSRYLVLPVTEERKSLALRFASQLKGKKKVATNEKSTELSEFDWTVECRNLAIEFAAAEVWKESQLYLCANC